MTTTFSTLALTAMLPAAVLLAPGAGANPTSPDVQRARSPLQDIGCNRGFRQGLSSEHDWFKGGFQGCAEAVKFDCLRGCGSGYV